MSRELKNIFELLVSLNREIVLLGWSNISKVSNRKERIFEISSFLETEGSLTIRFHSAFLYFLSI